MKKLLVSALLIFSCIHIAAIAQKKQPMGANPYTYAPKFFNAQDGSNGRYWAGNKKYPAKAFIGEDEYTKIVVIKKNELATKSKQKLRKHKIYLGFYIDAQTDIEYCLYGVLLHPQPVDDGPDADVITSIAIKQDYGIGE